MALAVGSVLQLGSGGGEAVCFKGKNLWISRPTVSYHIVPHFVMYRSGLLMPFPTTQGTLRSGPPDSDWSLNALPKAKSSAGFGHFNFFLEPETTIFKWCFGIDDETLLLYQIYQMFGCFTISIHLKVVVSGSRFFLVGFCLASHSKLGALRNRVRMSLKKQLIGPWTILQHPSPREKCPRPTGAFWVGLGRLVLLL